MLRGLLVVVIAIFLSGSFSIFETYYYKKIKTGDIEGTIPVTEWISNNEVDVRIVRNKENLFFDIVSTSSSVVGKRRILIKIPKSFLSQLSSLKEMKKYSKEPMILGQVVLSTANI